MIIFSLESQESLRVIDRNTESPYYRLLEKYFVQEIIFPFFHISLCVVLLSFAFTANVLLSKLFISQTKHGLAVNVNKRRTTHNDM